MTQREPRIEALRRWCDDKQGDPLAQAPLKQMDLAHLLEAYRPAALTYKPKTSEFNRGQLYAVIRENGTGSAIDLLNEVLRDLQRAEAALKGGVS